eukprot:9392528-Ditylum_brightwellii.AAC.1
MESERLYIHISKDDWKYVPLSDSRSAYHYNGQIYHLHPEFVQVDINYNHMTCLCDVCNKSISLGDIPELSIANGIEFGDYHRLGLTPPNEMKKAIISKMRMYYKGKLLDPARMKGLLQIHFVGPDKRSIDFLTKETLGSFVIKERACVIYQWLAVLSLTHPSYDELDYLNEIEYPEVQQ